MEKKRQYYRFITQDKACVVNFLRNLVEAPKSHKVNFYCCKNLIVVCHGLTYSEASKSYSPIIQIRLNDTGCSYEVVIDPRYLIGNVHDVVKDYLQESLMVSGADELIDRGFTPVDAYTHGYTVSVSPYYPGPLVKFRNNELLDTACDCLNLDKKQLTSDADILSNIQGHFNTVSMYIDNKDKEFRETFMYSLIPEIRRVLSIVGHIDRTFVTYRFVIHALLRHLTGKGE